jgi:hypothetical protein
MKCNNISREEITREGLTIRYMKATETGWKFYTGIIEQVKGTYVRIFVYGLEEIKINTRHADFKKIGEDYWDFLNIKNFRNKKLKRIFL